MFSILGRRSRAEGVVSLSLDRGGFTLARVVRDGARPRLELLVERSCDDPVALRGAVAASVREHGLEECDCVAVLRPELYALRQIDPPAVSPAEMREAARWAIRDLVDWSVEDAVVDVFPAPDVRNRPPRINVVAVRRALTAQIGETARRAKLRLRAIDVTELALRNLAALLPEDSRGAALLALEPPVGLLTLSREGWLWFTRQLESDPARLEAAACEALEEKLDPQGEGAHALDGLLLEIQRSFDYYEHQLGQAVPAGLVLAPTREPIPSLRAWLGQNLAVPVRELDLGELVDAREPPPRALQAGALAAVGAALRPREAA